MPAGTFFYFVLQVDPLAPLPDLSGPYVPPPSHALTQLLAMGYDKKLAQTALNVLRFQERKERSKKPKQDEVKRASEWIEEMTNLGLHCDWTVIVCNDSW